MSGLFSVELTTSCSFAVLRMRASGLQNDVKEMCVGPKSSPCRPPSTFTRPAAVCSSNNNSCQSVMRIGFL